MYAVPPGAAAAFWAGLRRHMAAAGLSDLPDDPIVPDDLRAHWRDPDLLLSQTCGYPFASDLAGQVQLVATPCYDAPGCHGPTYTSFVRPWRRPAGSSAPCGGPARTFARWRRSAAAPPTWRRWTA